MWEADMWPHRAWLVSMSLVGCLTGLLLVGCQPSPSVHDQLISQGYPPIFADGFQDGCSSGRQAEGGLTNSFRKNVDQYLHTPQYSQGWDDGYRQCAAMRRSLNTNDDFNSHFYYQDRAWERQKTQDQAEAMRRR